MYNIYRKLIIIVSIVVVSVLSLSAKHIIGGVLYYNCLGNGKYHFTLKLYRDCEGEGAFFDDEASIGIYSGNGNQFNFIEELNIDFDGFTSIEDPSFPCLTLPPNICAQEGTYEWNYTIPNWPTNNTFYVAYQRCCRNEAITNIFNPDDTGITIAAEISPLSQQVCNSSAVYNAFPPTAVCNLEPLTFNHAATDPDGDLLVYEFCAPFEGGGPLTQSPQSSTCEGVTPSPACSPPYQEVDYIIPTYSAINPMGGNPQISINPNTGLITGTPNLFGRYVVGVCVKEYRNGNLLNTTRRDFQFNVVNCQPSIDARISSDTVINFSNFVINSCGNNQINFVNQSTIESNIFSYEWTFSSGTPSLVTTRDATITFPGEGSYNGLMILNKGTVCADTALINVNVYPAIYADYSFTYDTCVASPVAFIDLSHSGSNNITNWAWDFTNLESSTVQNPNHQFATPGVKDVKLTVTDINNCKADTIQTITWYPVPPLIILDPSENRGCEPLEIFINNLSTPIDSTYTINWDLGDGTVSHDISPTHTYFEGIYTVSVNITSPIGCYIETTFPNIFTVLGSPAADFSYTPEALSSFQNTASFTNLSQKYRSIRWDFGDGSISYANSPEHTFADTGIVAVQLIAYHQSGCTDTIIKYLDIIPKVTYFIPNAFTPNSDAKNDYFLGKGEFEGIKDFEMTIWNRWGEMIFQTNDPTEGWNGKKNNQGQDSQQGVYIFVVHYTTPRNEKIELKGFATLVR
ncbi:MAG: gliding motility-associated C-terminal domain-containing protein [Saprospiraceae bacterium]|nr:gliding motility-associated C-terminal domain-containing protein [Saprospiraceae bacterium]MBP7699210.1 gliding motility-associated C-terminal domain-containing protein [Saprospiraceae bacterium]